MRVVFNTVGLHRGHSKDCRSRIDGEMRETEEGKSRLEEARTRREEHDKKDKKEEGEEHEAGEQSQNLKTDFFKFPRECLGVEADSLLEMILNQ